MTRKHAAGSGGSIATTVFDATLPKLPQALRWYSVTLSAIPTCPRTVLDIEAPCQSTARTRPLELVDHDVRQVPRRLAGVLEGAAQRLERRLAGVPVSKKRTQPSAQTGIGWGPGTT